nr:hypothetical protein [Halogeometricum borinquense]
MIEGVGLALSQRVKSGEHSFILVRLSKLLPASEWAKRVVEDWRRLTGSVLAEHLHYADLSVDVSPPQAVPFFVVRDGDEFRATRT